MLSLINNISNFEEIRPILERTAVIQHWNDFDGFYTEADYDGWKHYYDDNLHQNPGVLHLDTPKPETVGCECQYGGGSILTCEHHTEEKF